MPILANPRHERFAQELAKGKSASEAYAEAGFKPSRSAASRLSTNVNVLERLEELQTRVTDGIVLSRQWVIERLVENVNRALQIVEIKKSDGSGTGEYKYEGSVANKALELLGKEVGMFKERIEHTGKDGAPIETRSTVDLSMLDADEREVFKAMLMKRVSG